MKLRRQRLTRDDAEGLALQGLTFLAGDPQRLVRFFSLTGLTPADLQAWADAPRLQVAVLDYLLSDESLLLVFAAESKLAPEQIVPARDLLAGDGGAGIWKSI
ncbi:MAG: DUF3572 domain-containing protein [Hyphomicrobium sp.]